MNLRRISSLIVADHWSLSRQMDRKFHKRRKCGMKFFWVPVPMQNKRKLLRPQHDTAHEQTRTLPPAVSGKASLCLGTVLRRCASATGIEPDPQVRPRRFAAIAAPMRSARPPHGGLGLRPPDFRIHFVAGRRCRKTAVVAGKHIVATDNARVTLDPL